MTRVAAGPHHVRTESHGHHVGLDAPVLRVADGGERCQDSFLVDGAHGQDILRIAGRGDFLPRIHAGVTGAAHQHHAFVGNVGCLAGHQLMPSVQLAQADVLRRVIEGEVAQ